MSTKRARPWTPALTAISMFVFVLLLPVAMKSASVQNWNAIQMIKYAIIRADGSLQQIQRIYLIKAMLLYIPYESSNTLEPLDSWFGPLELREINAWDTLLARIPTFVAHAPPNAGWSWLGYDLNHDEIGNKIVRIYAESPRTLEWPPSILVSGRFSTLRAGQRLYQDIVFDKQQIRKPINASQETSSNGCPERKSIIGTKAIQKLLARMPLSVYTVPITRHNQLCYFSLIWSGSDDLDEINTNQVITEDDAGIWVMIEFSMHSPYASFPFWKFAYIPTTLGWQSYNSQTSVEPTSSGLSVSASSNDAAIVSPEISLDARQVTQIIVTVRANTGNTIQLFWKTLNGSNEFTEELSLSQHLYADSDWHIYQFNLANHPQWQGIVTRLRLDPINMPGYADIAEVIIQ